ncbi:MAG TPA: hypothetical protein VJ201_03780 [Candidatus Babeliales bacterium]|nr:hypothetical protein [Candidatus Babeliales bacterium]
MKICPVCKNQFDDGGNAWKKVCYVGYKSDIYITHLSVTKEELDKWINEKGYEKGWGAEEIKSENWSKFKMWRNDTNYD